MINVPLVIIAVILSTAGALAVPTYSAVNCANHTELSNEAKHSSPFPKAVEARDEPIESGKGMCANHLTDDDLEQYVIVIGKPWNNGAGCKAVQKTFNSKIPTITEWKCREVADDSGNTILTFDTVNVLANPMHADEALAIAYPDVTEWHNACNDNNW
ncbi:hypothetical protein PRZ48_011455 [Zasmidium cellare]|uniref:Secreted protein n=1 Tax=Zasmidium cellare TaxID=395010 RepID=A0ABR0E714_ZASCE|nr:hypothetical protein PRZ48_011455 [Zasmidium cellare]